MYKHSLTTLILILACSLAWAQDPDVDAWKYDIDYLKTELPRRHKNLFFSMDMKVYEAALNDLSMDLSGKSNIDIVLSLQQIMAQIGDDHTGIEYRQIVQNAGVFPLQVYWFSDGLHVLATLNKYQSVLGNQLMAINGIPIAEVTTRLSNLTAKTNEALIKHRVPNLLPLIGLLQHFGIVKGDSATFEFIDQHGVPKSLLIEKLDVRTLGPDVKFVFFTPGFVPLCRQNQHLFFWSRFLDEDRILYAQYNRCWSKELEEKHGSKSSADRLPSFVDFSAGILASLNDPKTEKCILDLRFNPGGSSPQGTELAKAIGSIPRINQRGRLFVVIGKRTFSSAVINAIDFQTHTKAILIGEPTSGKPNHYGEVKKFTLPKSGLPVSYSTKYFKYLDEDPDSLRPDIKVETSFKDYASGTDPVLDVIRQYQPQ